MLYTCLHVGVRGFLSDGAVGRSIPLCPGQPGLRADRLLITLMLYTCLHVGVRGFLHAGAVGRYIRLRPGRPGLRGDRPHAAGAGLQQANHHDRHGPGHLWQRPPRLLRHLLRHHHGLHVGRDGPLQHYYVRVPLHLGQLLHSVHGAAGQERAGKVHRGVAALGTGLLHHSDHFRHLHPLHHVPGECWRVCGLGTGLFTLSKFCLVCQSLFALSTSLHSTGSFSHH